MTILATKGCGNGPSRKTPPQQPAPVPSWVLSIDQNGLIVESGNITVDGGLRQGQTVSGAAISVDDISASSTTISITNRSGKELRLNKIVATNADPTEITIINDGPSEVVVNGLIDNPFGRTTIRNPDGNVRGGAGASAQANQLTLVAKVIGSDAARLKMELVRSPGRKTALTADTSGDVFLDLTGQLRDVGAEQAVFATTAITAGGSVDLRLRPAAVAGLPIASSYDFQHLAAGANVVVAAAASGVTDPIVNLLVNTDVLGSGHVDALTNGNISIVEAAGDLRVGQVRSNAGDVSLAASDAGGSVYDVHGADGTAPSVIGNNVSLDAPSGAIGAVTGLLTIDSAHQTAGAVNARAHDGVFFEETEGDLNIGAVVSRYSDVMLVSLGGSMLDAAGDAEADVQGANIDLVARGGGVGSEANDIELSSAGVGQHQSSLQADPAVPGVGRLLVESQGGVYLTEVSAALNVLQATSALGAVRLKVNDSALRGEDLNLLASGQTQLGAPVVGGLVSAPLAIELWAGDDVTVPPAALVRSDLSVIVRGDSRTPDPDPSTGATIDIQGDLRAPSVEIGGGGDSDFLQIDNPDGINAAGTTVMRGYASDDRFFVRALAGATALQGDSGADRFYIASNATKALFMGAGYYDDSGDPLVLLSGDLTRLGGLTIVTGTGGNGGTRDGIYLSADTSTAGLSGTLDGSKLTGLGMAGVIAYSTTGGTALRVELGKGDDTMQVTDPTPSVVFIHGGPGTDAITCSASNCSAYPD